MKRRSCTSHILHTELKKLTITNCIHALEAGVLHISPAERLLLPISVMAFRPKQNEERNLVPGFQDRLSHDAGAFLTNDPAISVIRKSGNYGFDPVMRSFKYDQLNLVIDGAQCATAACPNRMDPQSSQIAMNMLERVEIVKGPHSLRYGNAFGGTMNFVSAPPSFSEQRHVDGRISASYESNKNNMRTEAVIGLSGKVYDLNIFGSWSMGGDYQDGDGNSLQSEFNRGSAGANMSFRLSENQELTFSATRNVARDVEFAALPMDLREDDTWLANIRHERGFQGS